MQFGARPDLRLSSGRYDRSDPIRSRTPIVRPTKYPTTIASTKHRIVVSGVSTMVYRQLVPQASERFDNHLGMKLELREQLRDRILHILQHHLGRADVPPESGSRGKIARAPIPCQRPGVLDQGGSPANGSPPSQGDRVASPDQMRSVVLVLGGRERRSAAARTSG